MQINRLFPLPFQLTGKHVCKLTSQNSLYCDSEVLDKILGINYEDARKDARKVLGPEHVYVIVNNNKTFATVTNFCHFK